MENPEHITKYDSLGVTQKLIIQNEKYVFKKELNNDLFSYVVVHRKC